MIWNAANQKLEAYSFMDFLGHNMQQSRLKNCSGENVKLY